MSRFCLLLIAFNLLSPETIYAQKAFDNRTGHELPLDDFPRFIQGYRLQLGAFSQEQAAKTFRDSLQQRLEVKVHLYYDAQLWRVRIGDFYDSEAANRFNNSTLKLLGFEDAIVVVDKVKAAVSVETNKKRPGYRLQVKALSNREKALEFGRKMQVEYPEVRSYVIATDSLFKIQLGDFHSKKEAEDWQKKGKDHPNLAGWVVQTRVYENPPPAEVDNPSVDDMQFYDDE